MHTDEVRFRQILTNLIGNALKFTDEGSIDIGYRVANDNYLTLFVKDTGIGIPKDKIPLIFERFNKFSDEKKLYGGTGLGLTISKKLVEQMGGNIAVSSKQGEGSVFEFTVPYFCIKLQHKTPAPLQQKKNEKYNWGSKSLLIVEDVESNFKFLQKALRNTNIKITWAKNGDEALNYCQTQIPDAVLMDIQLPGKNGDDLTREILNIYPKIPIIAQTAYAFNDEKEKILKAGCIDCLTKPINSEILFETISKYLI